MQVLSFPFSPPSRATVVALGCFDGTHVGHKALFDQTVALSRSLDATPAVFTFSDFLSQKGAPLSTLDERLAAMEARGIEAVYLSPFSAVRDLSPTDFILSVLRERLGAVSTVCGFNYRFGAGARGDGDTLRAHFRRAVQVPAVTFGDAPVSSTRIRASLAAGALEDANAMLGRPYSVTGTVEQGKGIGHSFGFPTANITVPTLLPAHGVYETRVTVDGKIYTGLSDVGVRPTLEQSGEERVESFLLDFTGDLYGKRLTVSFLHRLRNERRFENQAELMMQIKKDVEMIRSKQR